MDLIPPQSTPGCGVSLVVSGKRVIREIASAQFEAAAHVRVQAQVDAMAAERRLPEPASAAFMLWLHREFYRDAPAQTLHVRGAGRAFVMEPGAWRSQPGQMLRVGRHAAFSSERVADFMGYFAERYRFDRMGKAGRVIAMAAAHHRFNYIRSGSLRKR